jgi:aminopeptidase N
VAPIPGTFGQGFPGLVYLSTLAYLNPSDRPPGAQSEHQRTFFSELLHAHETAHQWWGNLVTSSHYQDDWLMEALANYSSMLILERKKGRRALDAVLDEYRDHLLAKNADGRTAESAGPIVWGLRLHSSQFAGSWRPIVYEKGSWILHMLRMRMGEDRFLKMLGELAKRKQYKPITTQEFQALAAEFLPPKSEDPKLEAFFEQWVYNTGIPTLRLKYDVQGKAPKARVRGTVTQTDADDEFSALVPVEIHFAAGRKPITYWVRTSSEPSEFSIATGAAPVRVLLDPANAVLSRK